MSKDNSIPSHATTLFFDAFIDNVVPRLRSAFDKHAPAADLAGSEDSCIITVGGFSFAVMSIASPYPSHELEQTLRHNYTFKNSEALIENQKHHIIISSLTTANDLSHAIRIAISLTHITAIVAQLHDIQAVMWNNSGVIQSPEVFNCSLQTLGRAIAAQNEGQAPGNLLPLTLWTGPRFFSPTKKIDDTGVMSEGLRAFDRTELKLTSSDRNITQSAEEFYQLISYLFQSGASFQLNDTLQLGEKKYSVSKQDKYSEITLEKC
jgi:hypothetical protein